MGPLVPDIISTNLNYIVALVIGIFFGAILEQAGFSTSKKLVGLFYGYDFTVLRVFFTAGVVAMIGVMGLSYFGLLDINLVYINPTFFWSAVVGGVIMGLGFVVGGFCPGTSVCAAAIGKIDAMIFIAGAFIGVLIFGEGYEMFEPLYKTTNWGAPRIFDSLGLSQSVFAFLMTSVALFAFWMTSIIENKVNKVSKPPIRFTPYYVSLGVLGLVIALSAFAFPDRKSDLLELNLQSENIKIDKMSVDEFAYRIMDEYDNKLQVIDFRKDKEFKKMSLPKSTQFTIDNLFEKEPNRLLALKHKINVFIAEDEATAIKYAAIAKELGYKRIKVLDGGLDKFKQEILNYQIKNVFNSVDEENTNRFRLKAKEIIPVMISQNKISGPVVKKQKRVVGGC